MADDSVACEHPENVVIPNENELTETKLNIMGLRIIRGGNINLNDNVFIITLTRNIM